MFVFYFFLAPIHLYAHNEQIPCSVKTLTHPSPPKSQIQYIPAEMEKKKLRPQRWEFQAAEN